MHPPLRCTLIALLLLLTGLVRAQGVAWSEANFEAALEQAAAEHKLVFVDAYAVWCGPCRRMSNEVFPREEVGEFFNEHFVSLKIDMEQAAGKAFGKRFVVSSFPTLLFISPDGELVHRVVGAQRPDDLVDQARRAVAKLDDSADYAERYLAGDRSPDLVLGYVRALNRASKPSLAVVNDYLRQHPSTSDSLTLDIVFEGMQQTDSRVFERFIAEREALDQRFGRDAVDAHLEAAAHRTLERALTYRSETLFEEAKSVVSEHLPARGKGFAAQANLALAKQRKDPALAYKAARQAVEADGGSAADHHRMAVDLLRYFPNAPKALGMATRLAGKAAKLDASFEHLFTHAELLAQTGKARKARTQAAAARDALTERGQPDAQRMAMINDLIERLTL